MPRPRLSARPRPRSRRGGSGWTSWTTDGAAGQRCRRSCAVDLASLGLTEADLDAAAWFVDPGGRLHRGHDAIAQALRTSRHAPVRLLGRVIGSRALRPVATRVYVWVSDNRHRLPGGTDVCRLDERPPA